MYDVAEVNGRLIMTQFIMAGSKITVGSKWLSSSNNVVTVERVEPITDAHLVYYSWIEKGVKRVNDKDSFSFQCRYCLILEGNDRAAGELIADQRLYSDIKLEPAVEAYLTAMMSYSERNHRHA